VQPFGGEGLSGTGPKAGGPNYLRRLVHSAAASAAAAIEVVAALPGPTGESNTPSLHPRGRVACVADDDEALRAQIRLAAATGNVVLVSDSDTSKRIAAQTEARCEIVTDPIRAAPDAVLFAGSDERALELRQVLAAREGPIVPLLRVDAMRPADPMRLLCERTLTINTTASGGNASLLSLSEDGR